jgi:hypothetical protein
MAWKPTDAYGWRSIGLKILMSPANNPRQIRCCQWQAFQDREDKVHVVGITNAASEFDLDAVPIAECRDPQFLWLLGEATGPPGIGT